MGLHAIDTFAAVKQLRDLGMPEDQATGVVQIVTAAADQRMAVLATKEDLREEIAKVNHTIEVQIGKVYRTIETEIATVNISIAQLRGELKAEIIASQNRVILWVVGAIMAVPGIYIGLAKAVGLF